MILLAALGFARAQAPAAPEAEEPIDYSEVVLVWADNFARWRNTRWWVGMEMVYPIGLQLAAENNKQFRTVALQAKAVIACDEQNKLGRRSLEVLCKIEDIALQATSINRFKTDKDRQYVQEVLDEIDASLTGAAFQIQTNERGSITNVGMEGLDTSNLRKRTRAETLRQILSRLIYPFHMKLPKSGVREGQWVEYDSDLMSMPSADGSQGSTMIVHYMNFYKGYLLVQDIGAGQVTVSRPEQTSWMPDRSNGERGQAAASSKGGGGLGGSGGGLEDAINQASFAPPQSVFDVPLGYKLHMDGVSIFNIDNGVMEERVWSMTGRPRTQNPGRLQLWYSGKIKLLDEKERPDLGPTRQIGYPKAPIPGLPAWLPVDPEMQKELYVPPPPPMPKKHPKKNKK